MPALATLQAMLAAAAIVAPPPLVDCGPAHSNHLRVERSCFAANEPIAFTWHGLSHAGDWITIMRADRPANVYGQWTWSGGTELERTGGFVAPPEPGEYELRVYYDWPRGGYEIRDRLAVRVMPADRAAGPRAPQTLMWGQNAVSLRGKNGTRAEYRCPANGRAGIIWGSGLYTDDSCICSAAVHGGLISLRLGGPVTIEIRPGAGSYRGSSKNGIDTRAYGSWGGSFVLVDESGDALE